MILEGQKFEIVGPRIPVAFFVVGAWTRNLSFLGVKLKSRINSKMKILRLSGISHSQVVWLRLAVLEVLSGAQVSGSSFLKLGYPWRNWNHWVSQLIVFPRKENEVVTSATLEFLIGNGFEMHGVVFSDSRVELSDHVVEAFGDG